MKKKQDVHWMSISDMMSALMIIFMFIAIAFMIKVQKQQSAMNNVVKEYAVVKSEIYDALALEFKEDLKKWGGNLNKDKLSISFKDKDEDINEKSTIYFKQGEYELQPALKKLLDDFMPRYIGVLSQDRFKNAIAEVRIEGHTSSEWSGVVSAKEAYFNNMKLSQERTRSVLEYSMNLRALSDKEEWLKKYITANGLSSSQIILDENGAEDKNKSRRVEFRVRITSDDKMVEMEKLSK